MSICFLRYNPLHIVADSNSSVAHNVDMADDDILNLLDGSWSDLLGPAKIPFTLYKHRKWIHEWGLRGVHAVKKDFLDTRVVIIGRAAVGKTVLYDRMRGAVNDFNWKEPAASIEVESDIIKVGHWAKVVRVIPGDTSRERDLGLNKAFNDNPKLEGVIYVVDWGYTRPREQVDVERLIANRGIDTVEKLRAYNLALEQDDLEMMCERIRSLHAQHRRPKWFLIAATKADLNVNALNEMKAYYHPKLDTDFTRILKDRLLHPRGLDSIRHAAVPVSGMREPFEWNGTIVPSQITSDAQFRQLQQAFVATLGALADRV